MNLIHSICSMKSFLSLVLGFFFAGTCMSQLSPAAIKLQQYEADSNSREQHYLKFLSEDFKSNFTRAEKYRLAQHLAFTGDQLLAEYYLKNSYDSMLAEGYKDVRRYLDTMGKLQLQDARSWILNRAASEKIVLFNENSAQLQQRAFFYTLLEDFYKLGYRYLSLYWLNPILNPNTRPVDKYLGYQVADPLAAEIVRQAKTLGFTLITYGDSSITKRTANVQDAVHASKLAALFQQDTSSRVLVLDEQAHIAEKPIGDFTPMATVFYRITGINPFTIDQTELCGGSSFEYGRYFYDELIKRVPVDQVSIAVRNKLPVSLLENDQYDLQLIFPPTKAVRNRADYLSLSGNRKETAIQPAHRELFLVQAYYEEETLKIPYANLIPADQTYLTDRDGYYWLFLKPGKYKMVYRDIHYNILSDKDWKID